MTSAQKNLTFWIAVSLAACQRPASMPTPERVPATNESRDPVSRSTISPARTRWAITPVSQPHRYQSITNASLEMTGAVSTRDSVTSILNYQLAVTGDLKSISFSGVIESAEFRGSRVSTSTSSFPIPFSGRIENNAAILTVSNSPIDCSSGSHAVVPSIQRTVVPVPLQLFQGMTWTDSIMSPACSGSLPGSLQAVRNYRVIGESSRGGQSFIILERDEKTVLEAEGAEGQHRMRVRGDGSGRSEIRINPTTGSLVEIVGSHTAVITVTASGREQRIVQSSREQVTVR